MAVLTTPHQFTPQSDAFLETATKISQQQRKNLAHNQATDQEIYAKAKEFEAVFIADVLKNAKITLAESSLVKDQKITDSFSTFMNRALAEIIVDQGGFGLTDHIAEALQPQKLHHAQTDNHINKE